MVNKEQRLDRIFGALADSTRRGMLAQLARGPLTIGQLGGPFAITKGAVTKHVKVLERAGLLKRQVDGRVHHCELGTVPLETVERWVGQVREFWETRLDDLADYLDEVQTKAAGKAKGNKKR